MVRCGACGTENPEGAVYCINCARKLDAETQDAVARQRAAHTATGINWARIVLAVVVALVVIAVLALLVTHLL